MEPNYFVINEKSSSRITGFFYFHFFSVWMLFITYLKLVLPEAPPPDAYQ